MDKANTPNKNITTFEAHLDKQYGLIGSLKRREFEIKARAFTLGEINQNHS